MTSLPTFEQIKHALTLTRPGMTAWARMMPNPRRLIPPVDAHPRLAGVLILLYPGHRSTTVLDERIHLVLTRRTEGLATHSGQISLPGGGVKNGETPQDAALRETREELGVEADIILGDLTPLYIPPSNYLIHPLVAFATRRPIFDPDPREVAEVVEVPLDKLLTPETIGTETWELRGVATHVPFYHIGHHKVWGATAMVLAEFTTLLEQALTSPRGIHQTPDNGLW